MEDEESKVTQYLIPANVATRFEFFPGFGWYEFFIVAASLALGTLVYFILGIPSKVVHVNATLLQEATNKRVSIIPTMVRVFFVIIPSAAAFFLVKRDPNNNMSLLYLLKGAKEFKQSQKKYLYVYKSGSEE